MNIRQDKAMISISSPNPRRVLRPLFISRVPAGFPSPADDYIEGALDLNEHLIAHREETFFMRVQGHSMTGAGIHDGDLLVVDRSLEAGHGDIVVAVIDGELTIKRLSKRDGRVRLLAENPAFAPIELKDGQELAVWGVVTSIVRRMR
jgi:DNA polymerase V